MQAHFTIASSTIHLYCGCKFQYEFMPCMHEVASKDVEASGRLGCNYHGGHSSPTGTKPAARQRAPCASSHSVQVPGLPRWARKRRHTVLRVCAVINSTSQGAHRAGGIPRSRRPTSKPGRQPARHHEIHTVALATPEELCKI